MSKLSFAEKIGILIESTKKSNIFIIVIITLIFLGVILATTNKKNEKLHKTIYVISTLIILGIVITLFHDSIGKMISYMMNNFFIAAFFPNLAIYMAALIATNIILWISIFSYKTSKQIKILNTVIYILMNYLLTLILNTVKQDSLDIFSQSAVYENKTASALISLSSTIFLVWIIFLIVYKILLIYLKKDYKPKVKKVIIRRKVKKLPENYLPLETPEYIYGKNPTSSKLVHNTKEKQLTKEMESMFTLEDYKLLLKMLNEQKQKEKKAAVKEKIVIEDLNVKKDIENKNNQKNNTKNVEEEQSELKKYNELLELYKMH